MSIIESDYHVLEKLGRGTKEKIKHFNEEMYLLTDTQVTQLAEKIKKYGELKMDILRCSHNRDYLRKKSETLFNEITFDFFLPNEIKI